VPRPRRARRLAALAAAAAALLGLGARPAEASPQDIFGFGPRSAALGATGAADAEGYEAVYGNPALLSLARSRSLSAGMLGAVFDLHAGAPISYEPLRGSLIGAVMPLPFGGILKDRIAVGLGFFTPFDLVVRARILYPEVLQFPIADRAQSVAVQAGIGVDLSHGLRVGGGFAALAALTGTVLVATDDSGRIGTTVNDTLVASYAPAIGASYDIGDAYRVGVTFRGALVGRFNVVITVQDLGSLTVPPLNISGVAQYDPLELAVEVARVKGAWRGALGATYKHWSAFPGLAEPTVRCPLFDPTTGLPFTGSCTAGGPPPPGWHDTVVPRVGVEHVHEPAVGVSMRERGGAFFEPSPAPAQTGASNIYENARLALTLGYGVEVGPPEARIALDLVGQLQGLLPSTNVKAASVPRDNPGSPSVTASGIIGVAGLTVGVKF
jgi:long-chain fatty acid transport protein